MKTLIRIIVTIIMLSAMSIPSYPQGSDILFGGNATIIKPGESVIITLTSVRGQYILIGNELQETGGGIILRNIRYPFEAKSFFIPLRNIAYAYETEKVKD